MGKQLTRTDLLKMIDEINFVPADPAHKPHAELCTRIFRVYWREHLNEFRRRIEVEQQYSLYAIVGDRSFSYVDWKPEN